MNLKFSVITPSFCQGRFIERTIQSVLSQNIPDEELEYVVCDAASNDETVEILKRYSDHLSWVSEPDRGQAHAVNKGIELTTGDIIAWINSDDIYYSGTFDTVRKIFESSPTIQVVYGDADHIDEEDRILEAYPVEKWDRERLIETCFLCQPAVFFRRSLVEEFGGLDDSLKYCMDYEFWLRLRNHASFYYLPKKLAGSRLYKDNKTLGQRIAVHYEINEMFCSKFKNVPDKWIFAYAHVKIEETFQLDRTDIRQNIEFIKALVFNSLWSFLHWNRFVSLGGIIKIMFWWILSVTLWLKFILSLVRL
jgi:glycosyltransferase involved in cell wall biosynthesis